MAKAYSDKLKDPRWQKKRLEILNRDGFKCQWCGDTESTLHVHHFRYNGEPWEADGDDLATICEKCHSIQHLKKKLTPLEQKLIEMIFGQMGLFMNYDKFKKDELLDLLSIIDRQVIRKRDIIHELLTNG